MVLLEASWMALEGKERKPTGDYNCCGSLKKNTFQGVSGNLFEPRKDG